MRVLSLALALLTADVAAAGLCRPSSTTPSQSVTTSAIESSTATVPTTATTASETSATESLASTSETATSASETTSSESSFTTLTSSTTLADTTSTTAAASTTSSAAPSETPGSIVGSGPVAGLTLQGTGARWDPTSFTTSISARTLIFNLVNNRLQERNGNYLCVAYRQPGTPMPLVLCPYDDQFFFTPLTCQQRPDGVISCTSPIGYCEHEDVPGNDDPNSLNSCTRFNSGTWTQFYVNAGQGISFGDANGNYAGYTAIEPRLAE